MTIIRQRSLGALATTILVFLPVACGTDSTGPGDDDPPIATSRLTATFQLLDVEHDCDPALDNPGDFQSWIEVWQDVDPSSNGVDWQRIATTAKRTMTLGTGERQTYNEDPQVVVDVTRSDAMPINVKAFVHEMDNAQVDADNSQVGVVRWDNAQACWVDYSECIRQTGAGRWHHFWGRRVNPRDDVFDLFNPDDEGCAYTVTYDVAIVD